MHFIHHLLLSCSRGTQHPARQESIRDPRHCSSASLEPLALERGSTTHIPPANCSATSGVSEESQTHELCPDQCGDNLLLPLLVQEMGKPALQMLSLGPPQAAPPVPQLCLQVFLLHPLILGDHIYLMAHGSSKSTTSYMTAAVGFFFSIFFFFKHHILFQLEAGHWKLADVPAWSLSNTDWINLLRCPCGKKTITIASA